MLIKIIINKFINFHAVLFCKYLDKNLDKNPRVKKNKKEAIAAPNPN